VIVHSAVSVLIIIAQALARSVLTVARQVAL